LRSSSVPRKNSEIISRVRLHRFLYTLFNSLLVDYAAIWRCAFWDTEQLLNIQRKHRS